MAIFMADLIPSSPFSTMDAFDINSFSLFLSVCLFFPIAGTLSDRFGRRRIMTIGGLAFGLGSPLLVIGIGQGYHRLAFLCQSILGICLSFWGAPMMAWMVESFPPEARLTSAAVGYNIGQACVGGFTPAIATIMVDKYGYLSPGFLLTGLAAIALFGLWVVAPPLSPATTAMLSSQSERSKLMRRYGTDETESSGSSKISSV
jgi:MHS family proline/betaine transporter-like MFS transporter